MNLKLISQGTVLTASPNMTLAVEQNMKTLTFFWIFELCYLLCIVGLRFNETLVAYHIKYVIFMVPKFDVHMQE